MIEPKFNGYKHEEPRVTDWVAGAETGIVSSELLPSADWTPVQSPYEYQRNPEVESSFCVTFSALRIVASLFNLKLAKNEIPEATLTALTEMGYIINGKFNFNECFTAFLSGTSVSGNTFFNVWESIRKQGLIPQKDWKQIEGAKTWNDLMTPPPQELRDKGLKFLELVQINWEWLLVNEKNIEKIKAGLRSSPIQIAVPVCPPWGRQVIPPCGSKTPQHALLVLKWDDKYVCADTYEPFEKSLTKDYPVLYAVKAAVTFKTLPPAPKPYTHKFYRHINYGDFNDEVYALQAALKSIGLFKLIPTGYFGENTRRSVMTFQQSHGIDNNGRNVGPKTILALNQVFDKVAGESSPPVGWWGRLLALFN